MAEIGSRDLRPNIRLSGEVGDGMLKDFLGRLECVLDIGEPLVLELFTNGGDADVARRIALEIRLFRETAGRNASFIGKTAVYSAGVTILAAFPKRDRYLTKDTVLLVHERQLEKQVNFTGPLSASVRLAREILAQLEIGQHLERQAFTDLIAGSDISEGELMEWARTNWYITAEQAMRRGLVTGLL